ncbi:MAG: HlyD family efflux transporter periplasmic adaptor subunit [Anaerolineales bacterium]|nr:HlyD family efflux transporter periplasmic adaptor subunit [Anaerolineales bacterium]
MKKTYLILMAVLALVLSACGSTSTPTPIPTIVVNGGNTTNTQKPISSGGNVVASAVLVPAQEAYLAFVSGGNVAKVNAEVGDRVTAGYILVELDNTSAQLEVERAQRALRELTSPAAIAAAEQAVANAQKAYDEAKKKSDSLGRRFADNITTDYLEAQVTLAQNALDLARDAYNKTSKLSSADPARAKATTNLYNAQRAYNTALANLNWFTEKPSENEAALTTANFNAADAALQEAKWYLAELKGESIPAEATGAGLAQLQQARDNLKSAQDRLEQTRLAAPISGVVAQVDVIAGEYAAPGKVLIVLSDVDQLQAKTTDLSERDITKVKVGDPAVILIDALGQEFNGTVLNISPLATILGGDVVYEVTLAFDEQPAGALAGMTADVTIGE